MVDDIEIEMINYEKLIQRLVYAVNTAITQDAPQYMRDNHLETNNRRVFVTPDCINENLRRFVVNDDVELIPFHRCAWEGRIIVDKKNKITYTISSYTSLKNIISKNRTRPHYLMSLLYAENSNYKGGHKQITLWDLDPDYKQQDFDSVLLNEDYDRITQGNISRTEGYKHFVVAYTAKNQVLIRIDLLFLDAEFKEIDHVNLNKYIIPDYDQISTVLDQEERRKLETGCEEKPIRVKLKLGIKPESDTGLKGV